MSSASGNQSVSQKEEETDLSGEDVMMPMGCWLPVGVDGVLPYIQVSKFEKKEGSGDASSA